MIDPARLAAAYQAAHDALLAERHPDGYWVGELSSSALSTATAVSALSLVGGHDQLTSAGLHWLAGHQNADGGWGDTTKSLSNISTTLLCIAAIHLAKKTAEHAAALDRATGWLTSHYGSTAAEWAEAVRQRYGRDRTFSVPILMNCALAGLVPWTEVLALPFELACLPQSWYRFVRLPVVSYALPALIAIGQTIFHHRPPRNPLVRFARRRAIGQSLRVLRRIQPSSGGYLEATPLTSFVVMALASIAACGVALAGPGRDVIASGTEFLVNSMRPDGSWPIDSNLSVWVTTLAVNALAAAGDLDALPDKDKLIAWLLEQQETERHPFTGADPGGWGWSHLPGSVPDADDTPGAFLALKSLGSVVDTTPSAHAHSGVINGTCWLMGLQNRDGGWPTFCRGWGRLPFDRSGADLTAHALRALAAWTITGNDRANNWTKAPTLSFRAMDAWGGIADIRIASVWAGMCFRGGLRFLLRQQRPDGSWLPLWFGNQHAPDDVNPTYGTTKVLAAYRDLRLAESEPARRGIRWLFANQNDDGGWGGGRGTPSSVEETALAVEVLLDLAPADDRPAVWRGVEYLVERVEVGGLHDPTPIGFYFAKLWYFEKMYPIVFAVAALGRAGRHISASE